MNWFEFVKENVLRIGYFNWWLVSAYILLLGIFLYGILQPRRKSEWKSAGAAQAWIIALYAEMYGTPLTAYFLMNVIGRSQADAEHHFNGHLWPIVFGVPQAYLVTTQFYFTLAGQLLIVIGAGLAIFGWRQLYTAVKNNQMATTGLYRFIRHPQYTGFFLFLLGSIINWPTIITVVSLPVLCFVYFKLAREEEEIAIEEFGDQYLNYMNRTGRFLPKLI